MKITIIQGAFLPVPPVEGGAVEKMWFTLGQKFHEFGHEVHHISKSFSKFPKEEIIGGVLHTRVSGFISPKSILWRIVLDAIYSFRAVNKVSKSSDIVITNSFWAPFFLRLFKKSFFVFVDVARMPKGQLRLYGSSCYLRANSSAVEEAIKSEISEKQSYRISVVPNPLPFEVKNTIDRSKKEKVILFCGRLHKEKGLDLLAEAIGKIDLQDWKVLIVGPWQISLGGSGQSYKDFLLSRFAGKNVELLDPIFDDFKLNEIYQKSSIFIYPSIADAGETFGMAPLEAMAWGAVPIVSNLPCFKDFIHHNENGLIFDHNCSEASTKLVSAINRLIGDSCYLEAMAEKAVRVRKTHSLDIIAKQFIATFDGLIKHK